MSCSLSNSPKQLHHRFQFVCRKLIVLGVLVVTTPSHVIQRIYQHKSQIFKWTPINPFCAAHPDRGSHVLQCARRINRVLHPLGPRTRLFRQFHRFNRLCCVNDTPSTSTSALSTTAACNSEQQDLPLGYLGPQTSVSCTPTFADARCKSLSTTIFTRRPPCSYGTVHFVATSGPPSAYSHPFPN